MNPYQCIVFFQCVRKKQKDKNKGSKSEMKYKKVPISNKPSSFHHFIFTELLIHSNWYTYFLSKTTQITKFMGPTRGPPGSCRPQMGPMLTPWTLLSGDTLNATVKWKVPHITQCCSRIRTKWQHPLMPNQTLSIQIPKWDLARCFNLC